MTEKRLNTRIIHKHETEANWLLSSFVPLQGEIVIYDIDDNYSYERIKIGDGVQNVNALPFASTNMVYVGPTEPTDPNIKVWINTAEEGTGVVPVLPRVATITLAADSWSGSSAPYSQVVEIATVTSATKVELNPSVQQLLSLQSDDIALMAENDGTGVVTVYSFGGKPSSTMTMQCTLVEVSYV